MNPWLQGVIVCEGKEIIDDRKLHYYKNRGCYESPEGVELPDVCVCMCALSSENVCNKGEDAESFRGTSS